MIIYVKSLLEGLMVYWDEVKDAAQYHVHLYISSENENKEIAVVDVDRNFKYYSFKGLARFSQSISGTTGLNYKVMVEAENRSGDIIDKSHLAGGFVLQINPDYVW